MTISPLLSAVIMWIFLSWSSPYSASMYLLGGKQDCMSATRWSAKDSPCMKLVSTSCSLQWLIMMSLSRSYCFFFRWQILGPVTGHFAPCRWVHGRRGSELFLFSPCYSNDFVFIDFWAPFRVGLRDEMNLFRSLPPYFLVTVLSRWGMYKAECVLLSDCAATCRYAFVLGGNVCSSMCNGLGVALGKFC